MTSLKLTSLSTSHSTWPCQISGNETTQCTAADRPVFRIRQTQGDRCRDTQSLLRWESASNTASATHSLQPQANISAPIPTRRDHLHQRNSKRDCSFCCRRSCRLHNAADARKTAAQIRRLHYSGSLGDLSPPPRTAASLKLAFPLRSHSDEVVSTIKAADEATFCAALHHVVSTMLLTQV